MVEFKANRVDPRALLAGITSGETRSHTEQSGKKLLRLFSMTAAAILGVSAFGAIVVKANDDNSAMMFMRQNARPVTRSAPVYYRPAPQAAPTAYYAPPVFYPRAETRQTASRQRNIVASYAPFTGFFPSGQDINKAPRRKTEGRKEEIKSTRLTLPAPAKKQTDSPSFGGRVTYCVRTCDGFYFPLSTTTGSDQGDEAACNRLCPTANTKLFFGAGGADIDNARARDNNQRYASLTNAFNYRKGIDKSCSCSANGYGLASDYSLLRDGSLRIGDVVMTKTGMKIFSGGSYPYRESNFSSIGNSSLINSATRETLRKVEQASLPGRSGLAARTLLKSSPGNEAKELKAATALAEQAGAPALSTAHRYVGPDRTQISR